MSYHDKVVLVTGGTGFIGSHFVDALRTAGATVRVPVHRRPPLVRHSDVEWVPADLTDPEECRRACDGIQYVVHAAGAVAAAAVTSANPMSAISTNLILTTNVLEAAWQTGVSRILIFGSSTGYPVTDHPVREEEMWSGPTFSGYFGYGWMRRYLERLSEFVSQKSELRIALARPTAVYGPRDNFHPVTSHVIPALVRRAVAKEAPFVVWGTGDEVRDFLHVSDLVRGCLLLLDRHATCDPVNIGYGTTVTISEVVQRILEAAEHSPEIIFDASKPSAIPRRMVCTQKAQELLGFHPSIRLEDGLRDTVRWYQEQGIPDQC